MMKMTGRRNFGYGKQMAWAGKQALRDCYGNGRYGTVAGHTERWRQFVAWCRSERGIRDARRVDRSTVEAYGRCLADKVNAKSMSVSYAQKPAAVVGKRNHVRVEPPAGLDRQAVRQCADQLRQNGHERIASVVELARELGLRLREASMLDARAALRQARKQGAVNITAGTKGGRGHRVDRWVPVSKTGMGCLVRAAKAQGTGRNLIPTELSWRQWNTRVHHVWAAVRDDYSLKKLHDLRAAYACERYRALTGSVAPVIAGRRLADRAADRTARQTIAQELGHARSNVLAAYIGGVR
jgi:hypothetical protein